MDNATKWALAGLAGVAAWLAFGDDARATVAPVVDPLLDPVTPTATPTRTGTTSTTSGLRAKYTQGQRMLRAAGFDPGAIDGVWGPNTQSACILFQSAYGLATTGQLDKDTWDRLVEATT